MREREALAAILRQLANQNTVIIVFANSAYREVLDNWLIGMRQLQLYNILVFALDKALGDHLDQKGIANIVLTVDTGLGSLWVKRMEIIMDILEAGFDIVHSDADAVWLSDPMERYFYNQPYDMIFSQGTVWPQDIYEKWEFVLCCGLFYIKTGHLTRQILREVHEDVRITRDDQVSFNRILYEKNIRWRVHEPYYLRYKEKPFKCSAEIIDGHSDNLRVALLPQHCFQRVETVSEDIYVKHIVSPKNSESKLKELQSCGCYFEDQTL